MSAMSEQRRPAAAASLAEVLYPDTNWLATPTAASIAGREYVERLGTLLERPSRRGAFSRLLRGLAEWVAAFRERQAVLDQLSTMSDRDLADIGLSRAQIHTVFDPEIVQARDTPHRAAGGPEDRALADLGLSRTLPCPGRPLRSPPANTRPCAPGSRAEILDTGDTP